MANKNTAKSITRRGKTKSASQKRAHSTVNLAKKRKANGSKATVGTMSASESTRPESNSSVRSSVTEAKQDLIRMNTDLQSRIGELEMRLLGGAPPQQNVGAILSSIPAASSNIISMVKELDVEIESVYELNETLEADLVAMQQKLTEEATARVELESQIKHLESALSQFNQLREDFAFVEESRADIAHRFNEMASQLENVTEQRDQLVEQQDNYETQIKQIQAQKNALEAEVFNLKKVISEKDQVSKQLADSRKEIRRLEQHGRDLAGQLKASEAAKNAIDQDLTRTINVVNDQNERIEELKGSLLMSHADLVEQKESFDRLQNEQASLAESKRLAEGEIQALKAKLASMKDELAMSEKALHAIQTATEHTTRRVRNSSTRKKKT